MFENILNLFYTALEKFSMSENTQTMALREAKSILKRNGYMIEANTQDSMFDKIIKIANDLGYK